MEQIELKAARRTILGKKARFLRRQGLTPAHLFGRDMESLAVQCEAAPLRRVLADAGHTRVINLNVDEEAPRPVMVREVQVEPTTGVLLHVDFYQVRMEEKVRVEVPVVLVGQAPALGVVAGSTLVPEVSRLTLECLPARIPPRLEVDVSSLAQPEQVLRVKDIALDSEICVITDPEQVVARISVRPVEVVPAKEAAPAEEAAEAAAEAAEATAAPKAEEKPEKTKSGG